MKNFKFTYTHTMHYDPALYCCGFPNETSHIVTKNVFGFNEWLDSKKITTEFSPIPYAFFVVDADGNRTGEAYHLCRVEPTDDDVTFNN